MEGSKTQTIPEVRINETAIADEESHHWRLSLSRQLCFSTANTPIPEPELNNFIAALNRLFHKTRDLL